MVQVLHLAMDMHLESKAHEALAACSARDDAGHRGQFPQAQKRRCWPRRTKEHDSFGATFEPQKRVLLVKSPNIDCDRLPDSFSSTRLALANTHSDSFKDP